MQWEHYPRLLRNSEQLASEFPENHEGKINNDTIHALRCIQHILYIIYGMWPTDLPTWKRVSLPPVLTSSRGEVEVTDGEARMTPIEMSTYIELK